ncbi:hypothetical protein [Halarchaeum acidiphilum]|uniref:hypothetical protein n=1 Tax=Halarchaeum acidiphilum TaxID=489138 RepID=UPI00131F43F2|nr:hypothetical protein [Halarchaeum acidiphilum]
MRLRLTVLAKHGPRERSERGISENGVLAEVKKAGRRKRPVKRGAEHRIRLTADGGQKLAIVHPADVEESPNVLNRSKIACR